MPATLLKIAQRIAARVPLAKPTAIVGQVDQTAIGLLEAIVSAGEALRDDATNWSLLTTETTFDTVISQDSYDLAADFHSFIDRTIWDVDNFREMRGSLTPGEWQTVKNSLIGSSSFRRRYRIKADNNVDKFFIDPTPSIADETILYEYKKKNWIITGAGEAEEFAADTDTTLFNDQLMILGGLGRYLDIHEFPSDDIWDEYDTMHDVIAARDKGPGQTIHIDDVVGGALHFVGPENVPDTGFGV